MQNLQNQALSAPLIQKIPNLSATYSIDCPGFRHANVISMMKSGEMMVPLDRIPALAQTLGMNEQKFLIGAIEEYHPSVHQVLTDVLGLPLSDAELGILTMFRMTSIRHEIEVIEPFRSALEALLEP